MSVRVARPLCSLLAFVGLATQQAGVWAQDATASRVSSTPGSLYVDRVIDNLAPEALEENEAHAYDREGWPRFLRLETRLGTQPFDQTQSTRIGYGIYGLLETPNHGTLSVDGTYAPRGSSGTLTLRQVAMPLGGGWLTSNELGIINTPAPDITRLPTRIYLPSAILQGVGTEFENPEQGLQLRASTGEPGRLDFLPASGFRSLPGRRTTLAGQWRINASGVDTLSRQGWTAALRHEDARGVSSLDSPQQPGDFVNANSTQLALRHEGAEHHIQGQLISTQSSHVSGARRGFWIDSEWEEGPRRHGVGAYRLEADLTWANLPVANDIVGAYVRTTWGTRQWSAEGSVDWLDSISGRSGSGYFATSSARWRLNRDHTLGAGAALRRFNGDAWNTYGDWRFQNGWGTSGLRLEFAGGQDQVATRTLTWDQEWMVPQGWALSTSLGATAYSAARNLPAETTWNGALSMSAPLSSKAGLRGNVNTERGSTGQTRHSMNLGANWRIDTRWSVEGNYTRSSGRSRFSPSLDPLAPPDVLVPDSDRSFYAVLRYEFQAGSRNVPLGGKSSDGGGRIEGTVYFDANRSGTQEASETGVPNVTVFLDNRYAVRTDSQGRFEFPFVASGARTVTVRPETLPLPWNVIDEGQTRVDVRLRESVTLTLPVQRSE
ncbi:SdrD B-like domain-containing protein [Hydrogenophaga sp.]|uniref:SdrD B-like domain-containing protein n=1 Tax=Hydrogenophaga sp. TaxID=1904254 RepID=UPI00273207BF|nr:SdrD B-like domain-containing protein [Hydrogenophaga sp.]MDP2073846.1 SdrD B-like domain-containing protein [Hydrogenophaga sp.]MDP3108980.1 SdrD B-like domain-containing protein [Hydrogenophaga sp.]MDZ4398386.1 SdrD B-like domain-containing protein [Hydrogenophaga sp.]